jgi:transcriptional regulator with PAS, ATPase and Fis domain
MEGPAAVDTIVGLSEPMVRLRAYIRKVACSEANVLITGETGTGKERVAQIIHRISPRASFPLICVNCAAIPDTLMESELFGYERGAFTGADKPGPGKILLATGGVIFLDEIGDMSMAAQAKILRVLESREVFPLGARRAVPIDVRFIAATNQDLDLLIAENKFRRDLYYRLNVARLFIPCLRERREDIIHLFMHYIGEFNNRYGHRVEAPAPDVMKLLMEYDWPGNIREIRNVVEAIFIDPPSGPVSMMDLPDSFRSIFSRHRMQIPSERDTLVSVLRRTNWNKCKAAKEMQWSRMTLYRKLLKYEIKEPSSKTAA